MREDRIISALIGLVGACDSNPKTADTDSLVIKALAFPLICPEYDDEAVQVIVDEIYLEKYSIAPGCAECTTPCGNTSDYDMRRIYEADSEICGVKLRILDRLQELAAYILRYEEPGTSTYVDKGFFYKALSYVSYGVNVPDLLGILDEAKNLERDIKSGGTLNAQEDNKN